MFGKQRVATFVAEFLGTGILTLLILSVQRSTIGVPFFVATAAGLTFAMLVFTLGRSAGGYFNPAITLALWTARMVSTVRALMYIVAQVLGAWAAFGLYTYFVNNSLQEVGGDFKTRIMIAEAVGAALFGFGLAAAIRRGVSEAATAAFGGLALMIGTIAASSAAIGLLNPAVALGVNALVWGTYVLGPVVGAVVGINLYNYLFAAPAEAATVKAVAPAVSTSKAAKKPAAKRKAATRKKTTRAK